MALDGEFNNLIHITAGPFIANSGLPFLKDSFCQTLELFTRNTR